MKRIHPNADPESSIPQSAQPKSLRKRYDCLSFDVLFFVYLLVFFLFLLLCVQLNESISVLFACQVVYLSTREFVHCSLLLSKLVKTKKRRLNSSIESMEKRDFV